MFVYKKYILSYQLEYKYNQFLSIFTAGLECDSIDIVLSDGSHKEQMARKFIQFREILREIGELTQVGLG